MEIFSLVSLKEKTFFHGLKLSLQNLMLWKWKKPQDILSSSNRRKFRNRDALFSLPSGHENIIEKTQKSAFFLSKVLNPGLDPLFFVGRNTLLQKTSMRNVCK